MKNCIVFFILTSFLFSCGNDNPQAGSGQQTAGQSSADIRYVTAEDGLRLRAEPSLSGKVVAVIPFGEKVKLIKEYGEDLTISGGTGKWSIITWTDEHYEYKEGWAFGGFLGTEKKETWLDTGLLAGGWFEPKNGVEAFTIGDKDSSWLAGHEALGFETIENQIWYGVHISGFGGHGKYGMHGDVIDAMIWFSADGAPDTWKEEWTFRIISLTQSKLVIEYIKSTNSRYYGQQTYFRGDTPFHDAIAQNNLAEVKRLFASIGNDPDFPLIYNITPLHMAAFSNAIECSGFLLSKGANINAANNCGATPLHFAVFYEQPEMVALFLQHGAKVDIEMREVDSYGRTYELTAPDLARKLLEEKGGEEYRKILDMFESKG
ncbi:MAG: hypothetical protein EHM28_04095 [Spirochaetaceae bacterium]|nr:MAG: hypothetical protein EHM28_04095 [Spirochaetaceae bacterium]